MPFHFHVIRDGVVEQERSYDRARDCTQAIERAYYYYTDRNEVVNLVMVDHNGSLIYNTTTAQEESPGET